MLKSHFNKGLVEAGCDEAGRGCLAGSVFAAAVILPEDYVNEGLNDSKKLTPMRRYELRDEIERDALAWAVGVVTPEEIDKINILNASILAMHRALDQLEVRPEAIIVDGNRFKPYRFIPYNCPLPRRVFLPRLTATTIWIRWPVNTPNMPGTSTRVTPQRPTARPLPSME